MRPAKQASTTLRVVLLQLLWQELQREESQTEYVSRQISSF